MKVTDLQPDKRNARKRTTRGRAAIVHSLRELGAGRSVVVDKNNQLIAGNGVAEAAAKAGITDVEIVESDGSKLIAVRRTDLDLSLDPKARELAIADNRSAEFAEWDTTNLKDISADLNLQPYFNADELIDMGISEPDFQPASESDQGKLDQKKKVTCPDCGHEFTP